MKVCSGLLRTCLLLCGLLGLSMPATTQDKAVKALQALTEGTNKFAIDLYRAVSKNHNDNVIVSPTSLMMVLTLAYTGARGITAKEMATVLGLPDDIEDVLIGCKQLIQEFKDPVLKLANKMFIDDSMTLKDEFQKNAVEYFLSDAQSVDFSKSEDARLIINRWVEDNTNNKIKDLFPTGALEASTLLVLVNAIHFKAKWAIPFDPEDTEKEKFYTTPDTTVDVDMMFTKDKFFFKHHEELGAKMLDLPYKDGKFHMIVILPDAKDGLAAVEAKLHTLNLSKELSTFEKLTVNVGLPKFKIEKEMNMNEILQELGMKTMFGNADLSGMSTQGPLKVSKVIQKAFIEVNEEGTEAAAASGMVMARCLAFDEVDFFASHPFIALIIRSEPKPTLLFITRLTGKN